MLDPSRIDFTSRRDPSGFGTTVRGEARVGAEVTVGDREAALAGAFDLEARAVDQVRAMIWRELYGELQRPLNELRAMVLMGLSYPASFHHLERARELADTLVSMLNPPVSPPPAVRRSGTPARHRWGSDGVIVDAEAVDRLIWIASMLLDSAEASGDDRTVTITADQADDLRGLLGRLGA